MTFVRPATLDDLPQLAAFDEWKRATEEAIDRGECFVAGFDDGNSAKQEIDAASVLAYGIFDRSFFGRPFIAILLVHPEHRRRGLGTSLIHHFESIVAGDETDRRRQVWISTNNENLAMHQLLKKLGYTATGVVHELADLPEIIYMKRLSDA